MVKAKSNKQSDAASESSRKPKSKPPADSSPPPPFTAPKSKRMQKLEEELKAKQDKLKQLEASMAEKQTELDEENRKADHRRNCLIGEVILTEIQQGNLSWKDWLKPLLNLKLQDEGERELFGLTNEALPEEGAPQKDSPQEELPEAESLEEELSNEALDIGTKIREVLEAEERMTSPT